MVRNKWEALLFVEGEEGGNFVVTYVGCSGA